MFCRLTATTADDEQIRHGIRRVVVSKFVQQTMYYANTLVTSLRMLKPKSGVDVEQLPFFHYSMQLR